MVNTCKMLFRFGIGDTMKEDFSDYGIYINKSGANSSGEVYTTCPQCSSFRKKKTDKCLSVNIDKGQWFCHHCGWFGYLKELNDMRITARKHYGSTNITSQVMDEKKVALGKVSQEVINYFATRGISQTTLKSENVYSTHRYMPAVKKEVGVIAYPFFFGEKIVNVKYRDKDKNFSQEKNPTRVPYRSNSVIGKDEFYIT